MISKKMVETSFPSSIERDVASTLLLLSCPISRESSTIFSSPDSYESNRFSAAKSVGGESAVAYVPLFNELKIIRKKCTKSIWISNDNSSSIQSCSARTKAADKKKSVITTHMGNQAKAILNVLSKGDSPEVRIRKLLGDSPTTSKVLRMLLKQGEVKRRGRGGRKDPYIYMIA